jgi:ABC-type tungstate transport system substrate-binding protein
MKYTLAEARSSPVALAVFLVGLAVFLLAIVVGPSGSWGAPMGSPEWLLGAAFAALAVALGVRSWLRSG